MSVYALQLCQQNDISYIINDLRKKTTSTLFAKKGYLMFGQ